MKLYKAVTASMLSGVVLLSLGTIPSVGAVAPENGDVTEWEGASDFREGTVEQQDVPDGWEPVDSDAAAEALRGAEKKLAEFTMQPRQYKYAMTGEIWIQYPASGGSGKNKPDWLSDYLSAFDFGHAAIVDCDEEKCGERTLEAYPKFASPIGIGGVRQYWNNWRRNPKMMQGRLALFGSRRSSGVKRHGAQEFAKNQFGKPYSIFGDLTDYSKFYCSKLVWAAWYSQGEDLDPTPDKWVLPMELANSPHTKVLWGKY